MSVSFLNRARAPDLAYQTQQGSNAALPTLVFLTGFRSDMTGTKAAFLADRARQAGQSYLRFDYRGHGRSGGAFEDGTIGLWLQDTLDILDFLTTGPVLLAGSSMGGWIALLAALARKERVSGLIGLAAAPDFTRWIEARLKPDQADLLQSEGRFPVVTEYSPDPYYISKNFLDDGRTHCLLDGPIAIQCPVRLIQGMKDPDVPWQVAHRILNAVTATDKDVYLREEGDHRLSTPDDLALLWRLVVELSVKKT